MAGTIQADSITNSAGTGAPNFPNGATGVAVNSEIILNTQAGYGSTGTKVIYYTNVEATSGTDLTYTPSSVNGDSITINTAGVYCVSCCSQFSGSANAGVSKNASSTSTALNSLANAQILMAVGITNSAQTEYSTTQYFAAGTVLRVQTDGTTLVTASAFLRFRVCKIV